MEKVSQNKLVETSDEFVTNLVFGLPFIFHVPIIVDVPNEFAFGSIFSIVQGVMPVLSLHQTTKYRVSHGKVNKVIWL